MQPEVATKMTAARTSLPALGHRLRVGLSSLRCDPPEGRPGGSAGPAFAVAHRRGCCGSPILGGCPGSARSASTRGSPLLVGPGPDLPTSLVTLARKAGNPSCENPSAGTGCAVSGGPRTGRRAYAHHRDRSRTGSGGRCMGRSRCRMRWRRWGFRSDRRCILRTLRPESGACGSGRGHLGCWAARRKDEGRILRGRPFGPLSSH